MEKILEEMEKILEKTEKVLKKMERIIRNWRRSLRKKRSSRKWRQFSTRLVVQRPAELHTQHGKPETTKFGKIWIHFHHSWDL